jgi:predicted nicotinamide N-methyase
MSTEQLILAMAPIPDVISSLHKHRCEIVSESPGSTDEQDLFAELISSCWTDLGSSNRYAKALIRSYVSGLEKAGNAMESDNLMDLVFRISIDKEKAPDPEESCYLSFQLPPDDDARPLLKFRVYPYHNDVALRLWEAGALLAEYFLQNPELVKGRRVIELGAGVGLTGLVIAGHCGAEDVFLTDYTEACRVNMAHNIAVNEKWLNNSGVVSQGYLEWSSFAAGSHHSDVADNYLATTELDKESLHAFNEADLLLAADVAYDEGVLKDLAVLVFRFLQNSPNTKQAIFGITRRNMQTFNTFLGLLREEGIVYNLIWDSETGPKLPIRFPCKFIQGRSDVRIASLKMDQ